MSQTVKNTLSCFVKESFKHELSYCQDDRAMLHKSNFCFRVGVPLFNALLLSNLQECHHKSYIAEN